MSRHLHKTLPYLTLCLAASTLAGCEESFVDEEGGVMDLYPFTDPKPAPNNPAAAIPRQIAPQRGYSKGDVIEFYDLGAVPTERTVVAPIMPTFAPTNPMYFVFDRQGRPLLSRAVRSERTGAWFVPGGNPTISPNAASDSNKQLPYSIRSRRVVMDMDRNSDAHQRPIIDVGPEARTTTYTGLWRIVEVVATGDYAPDDIKSFATLEKAIKAGRFKERATQRVINCPLIDERTDIVPSLAGRRTPQPVVEVWYRRKLGFCFLVNGWETLAAPDGKVIGADQDDARIEIMDAQSVKVTVGSEERDEMRVPVGKAFTPALSVTLPTGGTTESRFEDNFIIEERPGRTPQDAPKVDAPKDVVHSPIRWLYDFTPPAPADGMPPADPAKPYVSGTIRSIGPIDNKNIRARSGIVVKNLASVGAVPSCGPKDATTNACTGDATACTSIGLECNPSTCLCDLPSVGWGEVCAPGFQRCRTTPLDSEKAFAPNGYICHPRDARGFCQPRCDATGMDMNPDSDKDSRCGDVPGFTCVTPGTSSSSLDNKKDSICVRTCKTSEPAETSVCATPPAGAPETAGKQICVSQRQVTSCNFNDALYPF